MSPFKFVIILALIFMAGIIFTNADEYMSIGVSGAHGIVSSIPEAPYSKSPVPNEVNGYSRGETFNDMGRTITAAK